MTEKRYYRNTLTIMSINNSPYFILHVNVVKKAELSI